MSAGFHIRPATPDDVNIILQFINDLAVYEKEPDAVKATPELLRTNLFERKYAHALLAFGGDKPLGMALYFFNFSTWMGKPGLFLEDLYVSPEYRNAGIGKAFFGELGRIAKESDCARMDWSVLKWNQPSIDFYEKKLRATAMTEWMGMRLEEDGIDNLQSFVLAEPSGPAA
ncbi:acyl-CoA N-acyltransferase [Rhodocollybia butyracea]|uniref:Acyl-CoA N-acyltransferase n=1 Tax=Rhodocollybia butyracea TaxID=206335 RepID=A0A9P5UGV3_9AGAR|nr:acyl-CoA N-acyltransferase [Rhodocollybia butyracea]KAF9078857.1 acyl-CoA N-acyltransferase [Rhodocollybia butyracea]